MINRLPAGNRILGFPDLAKLRSAIGVIETPSIRRSGAVSRQSTTIAAAGYVIVPADNRESACAPAQRIERELVVDLSCRCKIG
jgi:hypothetical protein